VQMAIGMGDFEEDGADAKGYRKASAGSGDHGLRRADAISRVFRVAYSKESQVVQYSEVCHCSHILSVP
jgi:hypothetical protein